MNLLRRIWLFYKEGFLSMTLGKRLWTIILIKLFIFFVILRLLFFPNFLNTKFNNKQEKSDYVGRELIQRMQ